MPTARQSNNLEAACVHFRDAQGNFVCFEPCARGTRHDERGKTTRITDQKALAFVGHLSFLSGQVGLIVPLRAANSLLQADKWSAVAAGLCADCRWKPMIETIVQRLVVLPKCGHVLSHPCRTLLLSDDASNEIGNLFHFRFTHAQPGYFYRPHAQASWLIPIFDSVSRNEI